MPALIEFRNVSFCIGGRKILDGINMTVEAGETVVLLGRSGSGKTTLLKMVNRLVEPTGGEVQFEQKSVTQWDAIRLRRRIGYVIQDGGLLPHLTVEHNIGLVPRLEHWPDRKIQERVSTLLDAMGLPEAHYAARYPRQLSGGEKQRVGIARALAAGPPLLLLDEPFAALDPVTRFELQQQFLALRRNLLQTSLFVTHDIREALMMGSRIGLMHQGKLELLAAPEEFLEAGTPEAREFMASLGKDWRVG
jgi:osmoprotectant transport system ATP-binding protein